MLYFDPYFSSKLGKMYSFDPPFCFTLVAFRVDGRWWASLSETWPCTNPPSHPPHPHPHPHPTPHTPHTPRAHTHPPPPPPPPTHPTSPWSQSVIMKVTEDALSRSLYVSSPVSMLFCYFLKANITGRSWDINSVERNERNKPCLQILHKGNRNTNTRPPTLPNGR